MLHAFLINPRAGKPGAAKKAAQIIEAACRTLGLSYALTFTESPGDAVRITRHYAQSGEAVRLYACGGDGTLNQIVQVAAGQENLAVTNIPLGTGNDFLKLFGQDYKKSFWDLHALTEGPQAAMDLIDCNGTLGLDIVCAGIDARVAADVDRYKALPLVGGMGAYALSLAANVMLKPLAQPMTVELDGQTWEEPITLVCVCNGRYYGGGFMPSPDALPDDGELEFILVPGVRKRDFLGLVGKYAKGRAAELTGVAHIYKGPGPVTLRAQTPITAVADGEVLSDELLTIGLSDKKLNFFWPVGASYRVEKEPAGAAL